MTALVRSRYRGWAALGLIAALGVLGILAGPFWARTFARSLANGTNRRVTASATAGWTWPANPALIPALLAQDQEVALNAAVYPVAIVAQSNTAALRRLNQAATETSRQPHRMGFLAVIVSNPRSDRTAVATTQRIMRRAAIRVPWAVVLDPPTAWRTSTVQVYWPTSHGIAHAGGTAAFRAWRVATAPAPVRSRQIPPPHAAHSPSSSTAVPKAVRSSSHRRATP